MFWRWTACVFLLLLSLWFGYAAAFYYWAGSGPPVSSPEMYVKHGNIFFVSAGIYFLGFVVMLVMNIRRLRGLKTKRTK